MLHDPANRLTSRGAVTLDGSGAIKPAHLSVLRQIYARLNGADLNWAVTGSLCFALQGVPVSEVHDIDLQSDEAGVYEIERRFADYVTRKVAVWESRTIRSHFGVLLIDGVKVELMGEMATRPAEDAAWGEPINLNGIKRFVIVDDMRVPVIDLEHEYEAYLKMGRIEKAQLLRAWLDRPQ